MSQNNQNTPWNARSINLIILNIYSVFLKLFGSFKYFSPNKLKLCVNNITIIFIDSQY